jgi:hypothetical protein
MSKFTVGEVAIITNSSMREFPVGSEVTILEVSGNLPPMQYLVHTDAHGTRIYASDNCLRKKQPPDNQRQREAIGEWELCPWRPKVGTKEHA